MNTGYTRAVGGRWDRASEKEGEGCDDFLCVVSVPSGNNSSCTGNPATGSSLVRRVSESRCIHVGCKETSPGDAARWERAPLPSGCSVSPWPVEGGGGELGKEGSPLYSVSLFVPKTTKTDCFCSKF